MRPDLGYVEPKANKGPKGAPSKEAMRHCEHVLSMLKKHEKAHLFLKLGEGELDLKEVESKLMSGRYRITFDFACDVRKIWTNGFKRATGDEALYSAFMQLSEYFEHLF